MKIHKEGRKIVLLTLLILVCINLPLFLFLEKFLWIKIPVATISFFLISIIVRFFREPSRLMVVDKNAILSGADGEVVAIEEVNEDRFFNEKRIQVSVFMSLHNVHINWYPVSGVVKQTVDFDGRYYIARKPKSSFLNEHTITIIQPEGQKPILVRQIAGFMARRIVCYAQEEMIVKQSEQLGFIKFGSRVDILIPLNTEILVNIKDKVKGGITSIARYKD